MTTMMFFVGTLLLGAGIVGCGSDSGPSPAAQCDAVSQTLCDANVSCSIEIGVSTEAQRVDLVKACLSTVKQVVDCSRIVRVTGHPDVCQKDLSATPCSQYGADGLPTPASCEGIFANTVQTGGSGGAVANGGDDAPAGSGK